MKGFVYATEQDAIDKREIINSGEGYPKTLSNGLVVKDYCEVMAHPLEAKWAIIANNITRKYITDSEIEITDDWYETLEIPDIA